MMLILPYCYRHLYSFCEDLRALINAVIVVMLNGRLAGKG